MTNSMTTSPDYVVAIVNNVTDKTIRLTGSVGTTRYAYNATDNSVQRTFKMPPTLLIEALVELHTTQGNSPRIVIVRYQLHRSMMDERIPPKSWRDDCEGKLAEWLMSTGLELVDVIERGQRVNHTFELFNTTFGSP